MSNKYKPFVNGYLLRTKGRKKHFVDVRQLTDETGNTKEYTILGQWEYIRGDAKGHAIAIKKAEEFITNK